MDPKKRIALTISALAVVAAIVAVYLNTLPRPETHRAPLARSAAIEPRADQAAQAAAERNYDTGEKTFNKVDKRGSSSDTLTDACTGKPIPAGAPTHDLTSKADCTAAVAVNPPAPSAGKTPPTQHPPAPPVQAEPQLTPITLSMADARAFFSKIASADDHVGDCARKKENVVECGFTFPIHPGNCEAFYRVRRNSWSRKLEMNVGESYCWTKRDQSDLFKAQNAYPGYHNDSWGA